MNEYLFEERPVSSFQRLAAASNADVIVFGHAHKPYTKVGEVWFVNVGSVGKPKDGEWRACYAVFDATAKPPASFVRVPDDIDVCGMVESEHCSSPKRGTVPDNAISDGKVAIIRGC